jgi:hypothetical protein
MEIINTTVKMGHEAGIHSSIEKNVTGCLVMDVGTNDQGLPNMNGEYPDPNIDWYFRGTGALLIEGSHMEVGPVNLGDRGNVVISECIDVTIRSTTIINHVPDGHNALSIKPTPHLFKLTLDRANVIRGHCTYDGKQYKDQDADGDGKYDGKGYSDMLAAIAGLPGVVIE